MSHDRSRRTPSVYKGKEQLREGFDFQQIFACLILSILIIGCGAHYQAGSAFKEANEHFVQGRYEASLNMYRQIVEKYSTAEADRVLFETGVIYCHFRNVRKDYRKALDCFQALIRDYPKSRFRPESDLMIFLLNKEIAEDKMITAQRTHIASLDRELGSTRREVIALRKKIESLEQTLFAVKNGPADRVLIEKKERRLSLFSKDKLLKTYRIALGGNPNGPKEKQGDNKTPEGIYMIDSRNRNSRYHLALHISYPNSKDRERAEELGVSPGGDIMIHGIKKGLSWIGALHTDVDWTEGCIAVTDEEIEEIDKLVPNGTLVEIRP